MISERFDRRNYRPPWPRVVPADVLAFPKIQNGACLMMETPSAVQPEQLEQLKIRCVE